MTPLLKVRGIVTTDEMSYHVERLLRTMQTEDNRSKQEGFSFDGHKFCAQFFEREDKKVCNFLLGQGDICIYATSALRIPKIWHTGQLKNLENHLQVEPQ